MRANPPWMPRNSAEQDLGFSDDLERFGKPRSASACLVSNRAMSRSLTVTSPLRDEGLRSRARKMFRPLKPAKRSEAGTVDVRASCEGGEYAVEETVRSGFNR